jgi:pimeloyl-ACP methyl ester carboxylesterase
MADAPALVLLHALPFDSTMWAAQKRVLIGATYAPNLYSLGDTLETWAPEILEAAPTSRLIVVGCSVGGSCALEMAAAAPQRIAALVLIGTKAVHRPDPALEALVLRTLETGGMEGAWDAFWSKMLSTSAQPEIRNAARQSALRQSPAEISRGVRAFHSRRSRDRLLTALTCPVAVISGADDAAPGLKVSATQAALAPRGQLHIVPGSGHYVPIEQPDRLNSILDELIASVG